MSRDALAARFDGWAGHVRFEIGRRVRAGLCLALVVAAAGCADGDGPAGRVLAGPRGLARCPSLVPLRPRLAAPADRACQAAIARAGTAYVASLLRAEQSCVDENHPGPAVEGDPIHPCVGLRELSTGEYRPPVHAPTAVAAAAATDAFAQTIREACDDASVARLDACAETVDGVITCLAADHWEAAQLLLREQAGDLLPLADEGARRCRATVGAASVTLLESQATAIAGCLLALEEHSNVHPSRACIGEVRDGHLVAPEDAATAVLLEAAEKTFRATLAASCVDEQVTPADTCGSDVASTADCLTCAQRREAMLLVQSQLGGEADRATTHFIDWGAIANPVVGWPDRRIKDQVMALHDGWFYVLGSIAFEAGDPDAAGKSPTYVRTRDWRSFEEIAQPVERAGGNGFGSPDLTLQDGLWHVVFQSPDPLLPDNRRLFLMTTPDLREWSERVEVASNVLPGESIIDGALARNAGRTHLLLKWRVPDIPWLATTASADLGAPWDFDARLVAGSDHPFHGFAENGQFAEIDGRIRMLATARDPEGFRCASIYTCSHEPFLYDLAAGDGSEVHDWLAWRHKTQLRIPYEGWNTVMHANTGFLADWRAHDGFFYLSFSGANDSQSFQGRGHGKIGLARSRDLMHWRLPGDLRD